jgi:hypothetical protein
LSCWSQARGFSSPTLHKDMFQLRRIGHQQREIEQPVGRRFLRGVHIHVKRLLFTKFNWMLKKWLSETFFTVFLCVKFEVLADRNIAGVQSAFVFTVAFILIMTLAFGSKRDAARVYYEIRLITHLLFDDGGLRKCVAGQEDAPLEHIVHLVHRISSIRSVLLRLRRWAAVAQFAATCTHDGGMRWTGTAQPAFFLLRVFHSQPVLACRPRPLKIGAHPEPAPHTPNAEGSFLFRLSIKHNGPVEGMRVSCVKCERVYRSHTDDHPPETEQD